jgi:tyrosine-protein phosphatase YwqE
MPVGELQQHNLVAIYVTIERYLGSGDLIRNAFRKTYFRCISQLQPYLDLGCWLQVTAGSVTGHFGRNSQYIAHQLLEDDTVTVLASDGHNARARPPALSESFEYIANIYGIERARRLMVETPAAIVADQFNERVMDTC